MHKVVKYTIPEPKKLVRNGSNDIFGNNDVIESDSDLPF